MATPTGVCEDLSGAEGVVVWWSSRMLLSEWEPGGPEQELNISAERERERRIDQYERAMNAISFKRELSVTDVTSPSLRLW